jgi:hypothetical protein
VPKQFGLTDALLEEDFISSTDEHNATMSKAGSPTPTAVCMRVGGVARLAVTGLVAGCFVMLITYVQQPAFDYEYRGMLMLLKIGTHASPNATYTLWDITRDLPPTAEGKLMSYSFVLFAVVMCGARFCTYVCTS